MALSHSILATLIGRGKSLSGYDLAKEFNSSVGFYWKTTHQQIYRELARLEKEGMVTSEVIKQKDRPDKKIYSITETGMQHLIGWIAEPSIPSPIKEDMLVKMYVGFLVPKEILITELEQLKTIHEEKLRLFREYEKIYFSDVKSLSLKGKYRYLNLRSGISFESAHIKWCEEAIDFLKNEFE
ncbi:MAG TPA: PadR family transcriptional regulator [Spirochaetota bacterium]|nr:PadR family transcriptional regulator [Spirochaetota bacterium]HPJ35688.1 PadR family transcriptional regulator [Spirochaetota bacterium]